MEISLSGHTMMSQDNLELLSTSAMSDKTKLTLIDGGIDLCNGLRKCNTASEVVHQSVNNSSDKHWEQQTRSIFQE
jgi:hypothetical protein